MYNISVLTGFFSNLEGIMPRVFFFAYEIIFLPNSLTSQRLIAPFSFEINNSSRCCRISKCLSRFVAGFSCQPSVGLCLWAPWTSYFDLFRSEIYLEFFVITDCTKKIIYFWNHSHLRQTPCFWRSFCRCKWSIALHFIMIQNSIY